MTFHVVSIIHALASQPPKARAWRRGSESNTPPDTGYRDGGFEDRGGHQPRITLHATRACCDAQAVLSIPCRSQPYFGQHTGQRAAPAPEIGFRNATQKCIRRQANPPCPRRQLEPFLTKTLKVEVGHHQVPPGIVPINQRPASRGLHQSTPCNQSPACGPPYPQASWRTPDRPWRLAHGRCRNSSRSRSLGDG